MGLTQREQIRYGDSQADIRAEILLYSGENGYLAHHFVDAVCPCGNRVFRVQLDDDVGAAVRICTACAREHAIGDSDDYLTEAALGECEYPCGSDHFEITAGVSLYDDSEDVRWLYLGFRCPACGLTAVYGDWKNEYLGYQELLGKV